MIKRLLSALRRFLFLESESPVQEERAPEAALEKQQEVLRQQMARFNRSLAASAGFCELLKHQIQELERKLATLKAGLDSRAQAQGRSDDGDGVGDEVAGDLATKWHATCEELDDLRGQLARAEAARAEIVHARDEAIEGARKKLAQCHGALSEEEICRALAEIVKTRD